MYLIPRKHVCPACGFEAMHSPHDPFPAPVLEDGPTCPKCWHDFVRAAAPAMVAEPLLPRPPRAPSRDVFRLSDCRTGAAPIPSCDDAGTNQRRTED